MVQIHYHVKNKYLFQRSGTGELLRASVLALLLESKCTTSAAKRIPQRAATMWTFPPGYPAPGQGGYPPMPPGQVLERLRAPLVCLSLPAHLPQCSRAPERMYPRD